jgi:hypothetical protein
MSIRPEVFLGGHPSLVGTEGELVSVSIAVEPQLLERLLESLAALPFPLNPQICHLDPVTNVEFPAYAGRLVEIIGALRDKGFDPASVRAKNMLEQIRGQGYNTNWKSEDVRPLNSRDPV